jgi:hypothetical protein
LYFALLVEALDRLKHSEPSAWKYKMIFKLYSRSSALTMQIVFAAFEVNSREVISFIAQYIFLI